MNKYEFLYKLGNALQQQKRTDQKEILGYYEELIQDAIDSGQEEEQFISKLGSIDKIARTLSKDETFVEQVKTKQNFQLQMVFSTTVKIIGYFIFFTVVIVVGSIGISFLGSGITMFVFAAIRLSMMIAQTFDVYNMMMFVGLLILGSGTVLFGIAIFKWLIIESRPRLEKLLELVQEAIKKVG